MRQSNNGHTLTFESILEADSEPQVMWSLGNTHIQDGGRYAIKKVAAGKKYTLTLTIDKVTPTDGGTYVIYVATNAGDAHANINLNFDSKGSNSTFLYDWSSLKIYSNLLEMTRLQETQTQKKSLQSITLGFFTEIL